MIKNKEKAMGCLCISVFLAFTIGIYAPISIYCANANEYWYTLGMIWYVPAITFAILLIAGFLISYILSDHLWNIGQGAVFGLGLCFYIQGNFIRFKVGIFDGAYVDWNLYRGRFILDIFIWLFIILLSIVAVNFDRVRKIVKYISIFITAIQLISLFVMVFPVIRKEGLEVSKKPAFTSENLYEVGDDNIILICLDTLDEEYIDYIINECPELSTVFDGFEFYDNCISGYRSTTWSFISSFVVGKDYHNEMPRQEWVEDNAKNRLYFDELVDNGFDISIYTDKVECFPERVRKVSKNYEELKLKFDNTRTCFSTLYKIAGCVYFPDFVKPYIWMNDSELNDTAKCEESVKICKESNGIFKEDLVKEGIRVRNNSKQFKFIHIRGTHEPFFIDENGDEVQEHWDWQIAMKGCVRILDLYFNELKEQGVYDNSTIIITGDHGYHLTPGVLSNPALLLKTKGAHGNIKVNSNETGLINLAATIADLAGAEDVSPYGLSILDIDENTRFHRYFYSFVCNNDGTKNTSCLLEYEVPPETNDVDRFRLTGVEYAQDGKKIVHKDYCKTCLDGLAPEVWDKWHIVDRHCHTMDYPYSTTDLR